MKYNYSQIPVGYYDTLHNKRSGLQSKWHWLKFLKFKDSLRPGDLHLDIGCGPGTFIGNYSFGNSTGVDIALTQIKYAKKKYGSKCQFLHVSPNTPLPFEDQKFDTISMIELIEHLTDRQINDLLSDVKRLLKKDGRLLLSTPNYGSAWPILEKFVNLIGVVSYEDQHINRFNKKRLKMLLQMYGFEKINVESYLFTAPFFASVNWNFSDLINKFEPKWITRKIGFLLFAQAQNS